MTKDGWRTAVLQAANRYQVGGDSRSLDLLVQLLAEQDEAKARLSEAGFGVTGTPWARVVDEVKDALFLGLRR
jgi:hypothetical protein